MCPIKVSVVQCSAAQRYAVEVPNQEGSLRHTARCTPPTAYVHGVPLLMLATHMQGPWPEQGQRLHGVWHS